MAIGHPFGAIGTGDVLTLATELRERYACYRAVGVCVGGAKPWPSSWKIPTPPEPHKQYLHVVVR